MVANKNSSRDYVFTKEMDLLVNVVEVGQCFGSSALANAFSPLHLENQGSSDYIQCSSKGGNGLPALPEIKGPKVRDHPKN